MAVEVRQNLGHHAENIGQAMTYLDLELRNITHKGIRGKPEEAEVVANVFAKNLRQNVETVEVTPFVSKVVAIAQANVQGVFQQ